MIFNIIEFILFILPALPNSIINRLIILFIYFMAHYFKLHIMYAKIKNYVC